MGIKVDVMLDIILVYIRIHIYRPARGQGKWNIFISMYLKPQEAHV